MNVAPLGHPSANPLAMLAAGGHPKTLAGLPVAEQTKAAAGQFEAIMVRQLLQQSVGGMLGGEGGGAGSGIYGYLLTDVLANKLTEGGGLGLGRVLQQQLTPAAARAAAGAGGRKEPL